MGGTEHRFERGPRAFAERAWREAYEALSAGRDELAPKDLEHLAVAAYLVGEDVASTDAWSRGHAAFLEAGDAPRAARCAFWLGIIFMLRGDHAQGGGWLGRAQRALDEGDQDCAERGLLLVPQMLGALHSGDPESALAIADRMIESAARFDDPDLLLLAQLGLGQSLIALDRVGEGTALLDEVMATATSGVGTPITVGIVYCAVLEACHEIFDVRRAREWTDVLTRWCAAQPDLVPYRGQCLVHRSQILQLDGAWPEAMDEAERACQRLAGDPAVGEAYYQRAELHRLRGAYEDAQEAYREANIQGRSPQPGLALLRLAQGRVDAASAAVRGVLDTETSSIVRARVLPAAVEVLLAAGDVRAAREASDELSAIAQRLDVAVVHANASRALGAVLLAEGDARAALPLLRAAWTAWHMLGAPYEAARVRELVAAACDALGDRDTAVMELDAARLAYEELGAAPDLERLRALRAGPRPTGGLSSREIEVLRLVATGRTNRAIANDLVISEKTVARHVSNIFTKLGVSSRAAATAYAYENGLVDPRPG
jgi:DNA-binding NarL/FixJ family response regulator